MFQGFPEEALRFYADIAREQDRDWFDAHRSEYAAHVVEPAADFILSLGERLRTLRPEIGFDPNHTGRGSFKKIHTDQRFRKGRDPFKTYAQIIFWEGPLRTKKENSVFLVHFDPEKVVLAAGLKYMESATLKEFRRHAADVDRGASLRDAVDVATAAGAELQGSHYKGVPRGYDPEHPNAQLLRHNAMYVAAEASPVPTEFHGPEFVDWCLERFEPMNALHVWCVEVLEATAKSG